MRRIRYMSVLFFLLTVGIASAQSDIILGYFAKLDGIRSKIKQIDIKMLKLASHRKELEGYIEVLASKIRSKKIKSSKPALLPDYKLQHMLTSFDESSSSLSMINKQINELSRERREMYQKFLSVCRLCMTEAEKLFEKLDAEKRTELFAGLQRLRLERDEIDRRLHTRTHWVEPLNAADLLDTNDPEELKERADVIRDEQDRLRKHLAEIDKRVEDMKTVKRFDRQLRDFQREQMLFAERSRVFQLVGSTQYRQGVDYPAPDDIPKPVPDGASRDFSGLDFLEPCMAASCEPSIESKTHVGIDRIGGQANASQNGRSMDRKPEDKPLDTSHTIRILTQAREDTIQQIKRLQILYDRVMEKTDILETE